MIALLGLILTIALAIAIAPLILGALGTMFGLIFTFILWAIAGFPEPKSVERSPQEQAAFEAPMRQLEEWAEEDEVRTLQQRAEKNRVRARAEKALLDGQMRDPQAIEEHGHAEP